MIFMLFVQFLTFFSDDRVVRAFASGAVDLGFTRLGIKPKSTAPEANALTTRSSEKKLIFTASLLDAVKRDSVN